MSWKFPLKLSPLLLSWLLIYAPLVPIQGQVFSFSSCPTLTAQTISATGVTGTWYEYERTPSFREHYIRCTTYAISPDTTNLRYNIAVSGVRKHTGTRSTTQGYATYPGGATVGNWFVRFPDLFLSRYPLTYYIVATDASGTTAQGTYIVLVSCSPFKLGTIRNVIVLTNVRFPPQATIDIIDAAVSQYVSLKSVSKIDQTNC